MTKPRSKLSETDFSNFNLRDAYITKYSEYAAALRDESLFSNYGIKVIIKIPKIENNVDEYSNFVDTELEDFYITTESVVPKFTEYRQNVSENGMSADGTDGIYPLQVIIPTKLHLPRNSRLVLVEYDSKEFVISREWVVLGTEMKQLSNSKTYTRIANCVASRRSIHRTMEFEEMYGIFYFDILPVTDFIIYKNLRALLCGYFVINTVSLRKTRREDIQEEIRDEPENQEVLDNTDEKPEWQEGYKPDEINVYSLKNISTKVPSQATFVIKPVTISVLY